MATVRVSDLIDIAILAFLIYHIFWFMRKTSSGRVLKGIMVLILTMGLASSIQLTATSWLLNRVVEWGILVRVQQPAARLVPRPGERYPPDGGGLYRPVPGQGGRPDGV